MQTHRLSKAVRVLTVAPIMALVLLTIIKIGQPAVFQETYNYVLAVIFLTVLPISAYPLQPVVPYFKGKGREGQRNLAIVMAVLGYILGICAALIFHAAGNLLLIYGTYLLSGLLILLFNKGFKIRASGHACGVAGPIALLVYFFGSIALISVVLLALVYWASLQMKRHTPRELILGTLLPVIALVLTRLVVRPA